MPSTVTEMCVISCLLVMGAAGDGEGPGARFSDDPKGRHAAENYDGPGGPPCAGTYSAYGHPAPGTPNLFAACALVGIAPAPVRDEQPSYAESA